MEKNTSFLNEWGADYDAKAFFKSFGLSNLGFTWKQGTGKASGVLFIRVSGKDPLDGQFVDIDLWPTYDFKPERVAELVKQNLDNFVMRWGLYVDPATGEELRSMKWVTTHMDRTPDAGGTKRPTYAESHAE